MNFLSNNNIKILKGVGEKRRVLFEKLGVFSIKDLIYYFPRSYNDMTSIYSINNAPLNTNCCIKAIPSSKIIEKRLRKNVTIYKTIVSDHSGSLTLTAFNNKFLFQKLKFNAPFYFFGKIKLNKFSKKEMVAPTIFSTDEISNIMPIYKSTENLSSKQIETTIKQVLANFSETIEDSLPNYIKEKYNLCDLKFALKNIHFPENLDFLKRAKLRLLFEELLIFQLSLAVLKQKNKTNTNFKIIKNYSSEFYKLLPFKPTNSQLNAINSCLKDMHSGKSMRRLIQGDVGSGKTMVAAAVAYNAIRENLQVAFMVPTEILAEQHFSYLKNLFKNMSINVELISSSTPKKLKRRIKDNLLLDNINLIVGTHALISDDIEFSNLGLVITDEQHRFGVNQRKKLFEKGNNPHIIVMSATPIPRSLAMVMYKDLDISIIDELPAGRKKIDTFLIDSSKRERAINFIIKAIDEGNQAYVVCPLVDENDELELSSAKKTFNILCEKLQPKYKIGLLHGKMLSLEKNLIMSKFINKEIDILVSTTVIEVGIDNKNATIMMIENAERLGLSQLHQLRGRVGRGNLKSYCILVSDSKNKESINRLNIIKNSNDGFFIANEDLKYRGPGDFFGIRQHGLPLLKCHKFLDDINILNTVKTAVEDILFADPTLESLKNKKLLDSVNKLFDKNNL